MSIVLNSRLVMDHLDKLESQSIYILREAYHSFSNLCMPWSMGKDSNVLIWLSKKAFCGHIPYPLLHIDTTYEFPEMLEFREWAVEKYKLDLIVKINEDARAGTGSYTTSIGYETHDPVTVTHELKTVALQQIMAERKFDALITGIRRDEDPTRAKERYFSPRNAEFEWDYKDQPPEFWNQFTTTLEPGEHIRVQPLLDWTEVDIWRYIALENIEVNPLYFSKVRPVVKRGKQLIMVDDERYQLNDGEEPEMKEVRFRTLGCYPLTAAVESTAANVAEVVEEVFQVKLSERATRLIDGENEDSMEKKKREGYF